MSTARKANGKPTARPKSVTKPKPAATKAKPVNLLSGGNPQIAKADGDAPVQACIAAVPGWERGAAKRLGDGSNR